MFSFLDTVKKRLGDFWWYTLIIFVATRFGDVINAVIGLWLVPRYVGQQELGAVLPLMQVTSFFGLPISILAFTFVKFFNEYLTRGELDRAKMLVSFFWRAMPCAVVLGILMAIWLMPHYFERIRTVPGSLKGLIVATAILSTTAPVFTNAMQGMKNFKGLALMNAMSAPIRLVVMLVTMPIRALSGYMLGQASVPAFQIAWSLASLRRTVLAKVKGASMVTLELRRMASYTGFVGMNLVVATLVTTVQLMIIRQRLPDVESAAYYFISRFAEIGTYAGLSIAVVLFPMASEAQVKAEKSLHLLIRAMGGTLGFGVLCSILLGVLGSWLFSVVPLWQPYQAYATDMVLLTLAMATGMTTGVFGNYEIACNRFSFLWYTLPLSFVYLFFIFLTTGHGYFEGILPDGVVGWLCASNMATLRNMILSILVLNACVLVMMVVQLLIRGRESSKT